jgi:PKD repeat protein
MNLKNLTLLIITLFCSTILLGQNYQSVFETQPKWSKTDDNSDFDEQKTIEGKHFSIIQFNSIPKVDNQVKLMNQGIHLLEYLGDATYITSSTKSYRSLDKNAIDIAQIWDIKNEFKFNEPIVYHQLASWSKDGENGLFTIRYPKNLDNNTIYNLCKSNNIKIVASNEYNNFISVSIPKDDINLVLSQPFVLGIEPLAKPSTPDDKTGKSLHRVNRLTSGNMNYTGEGVNVLVRDDGAIFEHIDFTGRMSQDIVGESRGDHGDGVGGIMCGAGNLDPINQGMAYGSKMFVLDYRRDFLDETMDLHFNENVIVTNSSYSDVCNAGYTSRSRTVDQQIKDNPTLMHVFSAGNDGESDCDFGAGPNWGNVTGGHKIGKNTIAVANLNYLGVPESSSSRGPVEDGRIKPDLAANGFRHVSTAEEQDYMTFGGTSAAAPVVAGVMAMLHEAYRVTYGVIANAATLKAIMLNTATDLGNIGPDFIFGWGSINAYKAALAIEGNRFVEGDIDQEETISHFIEVPAGVRQLRIMTYWHDLDGELNSSKHLINNINSIVMDPEGEQHLPWVLDATPDPLLLDMPATKGEDDTNNMEQVAIDNPVAGTYELLLNGKEIPFGTSEYVITWEFRTDQIDITYPNGGENAVKGGEEVIHWDAEGTDEDFVLEILDESGIVLDSFTASGSRRFRVVDFPFEYHNKAKVRITRSDGVMDESDDFILIANKPTNLELINDSIGLRLVFEGVEEALNYSVYILGEKYMEKIATTDSTYFIIPDEPRFKQNWISVSANFENNVEGERARAIITRPPPVATIITDREDRPCVDQPITFFSPFDTLTSYEWDWGNRATPETASGNGPHIVTYDKKGNRVGFLRVANDAGSDSEIFVMNVQPNPDGNEIIVDDQSLRVVNFSSDAIEVDSFEWDFGDGNMSNEQSPTHTFDSDGTFLVKLKAIGECGEVTLQKSISVFLSSTENLTIEDFIIKPNPNQGFFNIALPDLSGHELQVKLFASNGVLVDEKAITNPKIGNIIKYENLTSGQYTIVFYVDNKTLSKSIIVH